MKYVCYAVCQLEKTKAVLFVLSNKISISLYVGLFFFFADNPYIHKLPLL